MAITTRIHRTRTSSREIMEIVIVDGAEVGFVTKYRDSAEETHPWKSFSGIGMKARFDGWFFEEDGGKRGAISAVVDQHFYVES